MGQSGAAIEKGSAADVIAAVSTCLHEVGSARPPRLGAFGTRRHAAWSSPDLTATVESARYGARRPALLTVRFGSRGSGRPLVIRVGVAGPPGWWGSLYDSAPFRTLPRRPVPTARPSSSAPELWLKGARRSSRPREEHWQIEPKKAGSEVATIFALLLFLRRSRELPDLGDAGLQMMRAFARRLPERPDEGELFEALTRMRTFAFPRTWRDLGAYASRVVRAVQRRTSLGEVAAAELGVSRNTYYRWARLEGGDWARMRARAHLKEHRAVLLRRLQEEAGMRPDAARKTIQRHLARPGAIEELLSLKRAQRRSAGPIRKNRRDE